MINEKSIKKKEGYKFVRGLFESFSRRLIIVIINHLSRLLAKADSLKSYLNALK